MADAQANRKQSSPLSAEAFKRFLDWLDNDNESGGQSYNAMHSRLAAYFDRKNCRAPDDLADETLSRVARRLEEQGHIDTEEPAKYCYTIARYVFLENLRDKENRNVSIDDENTARRAGLLAAPDENDEQALREKMLGCLEKCSGELKPTSRDLIVRYYYGNERAKIENRRSIAAALGISMNALSIRTCRIRNRLEACVKDCAGTT